MQLHFDSPGRKNENLLTAFKSGSRFFHQNFFFGGDGNAVKKFPNRFHFPNLPLNFDLPEKIIRFREVVL